VAVAVETQHWARLDVMPVMVQEAEKPPGPVTETEAPIAAVPSQLVPVAQMLIVPDTQQAQPGLPFLKPIGHAPPIAMPI
jgi:hypothetical protein